jgi:hypothetical protein
MSDTIYVLLATLFISVPVSIFFLVRHVRSIMREEGKYLW